MQNCGGELWVMLLIRDLLLDAVNYSQGIMSFCAHLFDFCGSVLKLHYSGSYGCIATVCLNIRHSFEAGKLTCTISIWIKPMQNIFNACRWNNTAFLCRCSLKVSVIPCILWNWWMPLRRSGLNSRLSEEERCFLLLFFFRTRHMSVRGWLLSEWAC